MSKSVVRIGRRGKGVESVAVRGHEGREANLLELDTRVELIQALIPIGLEAVNEVLQQEVRRLAGERYSREGGLSCWGPSVSAASGTTSPLPFCSRRRLRCSSSLCWRPSARPDEAVICLPALPCSSL